MANPSTIFSKHLSITDVRNRLVIPAITTLKDFLAFPEGQYHVSVPVRDEAGRVWNFRLSKRSKGLNLKPVIHCADWKNCVRENQLREGDIIIFRKRNDEGNEDENGHPKPVISSEDRNSCVRENHLRQGKMITLYLEDDKGNEDKNGGDGGDDGNNGGGGGGGSGGNDKKENRDREGDSNGDQDKRSRDDGRGDVKGKNMDFMCGAPFGYKFRYHAGYENGYPVGQLKYVQVVQ